MTDPQIAFDSWLATQSVVSDREVSFRATSQTVYRAMWTSFCDALARQHLSLASVDRIMVARFLSRLDANLEHRQRYQLLLERVFAYLATIGLRNLAFERVLDQREYQTTRNAPMPFLTRDQITRLTDLLTGPALQPDQEHWMRDSAMCALMLGAGLKLGEALACSVNCIRAGWIEIPGTAAIRAHRAPLAPELRAVLDRHLRTLSGGKALLFASPRLERKGRALDPATAFKAVARICNLLPALRDADSRVSPQTLRNARAGAWVDQGMRAALIAEYLGFSKLYSAQRVIDAYEKWSSLREHSALDPQARRRHAQPSATPRRLPR